MQTYLGTSRLSGVGMTFVSRWPGQESNTEIAFITGLAAEWAYEKNSVKDLLQEPFSSGPLGHRAGAIRTDGGPTQDRHGPHLPFRPGRPFYIQTGHSQATRVGIVGIAERLNVTAGARESRTRGALHSSDFDQRPRRLGEFGRFRLKLVTQHFFDSSEELARTDGFRDIGIHSRGNAFLPVTI